MKKEQLTALGITEEQAEKIVKLHDDEINGAFIPKHRFDTINGEKKKLEEDLKSRDKQLEDLKKSEGDVETLKKQIETLQADNKKAADEHKAEMEKLKMDGVIETTLASAGAKNIKAIRALFDEANFKLQPDGTVFGLSDALANVQKSDPYLFEDKNNKDTNTPGMKGFKPEGGEPSGGNVDFSKMSTDELCAYLEANPGAKLPD